MKSRPHVVLIVMDTARAKNFSCYGYDKTTSPHIDAIAEEGALYANAISPSPWTLPSHVSMFTGLYPSEHGLTEDHILEGTNIYGLSKKHAFPHFLPTLLKNEGYRTLGFSNNPWVSHNFGFDKGFDFFYQRWMDAGDRSLLRKIGRAVRKKIPQNLQPIFDNLKVRMSSLFPADSGAERTLRVMKDWFRDNQSDERPFFVFFNFIEPHLPYTPLKPFNRMFMKKKYSGRHIRETNQDPLKFIAEKEIMDQDDFEILRALYDGEIAYVDSKVKEIYDCLQDYGMLDRTLLIITSDHGENIGEHNLMGHQFCLYDTLLRVPLIIRYPELSFKGKVEHSHIQLSDIFYTILDTLHIEIDGRDVPKRSIFNPDYSGQVIAEHEVPQITLSSLRRRFPDAPRESLGQQLRCIYAEGMKYIWNSYDADEMYDLTKDPHEKTDLCRLDQEQASKLLQLLNSQWASLDRDAVIGKGKSEESSKEQMDSEIRKKLKELGYI